MDMQGYREQAQRAAMRAGPRLFKVFIIYALVLSVLNFVGLELSEPFYNWYMRCAQYVAAGDMMLPEIPRNAKIGMLLYLLLTLMGRVVTTGWIATVLTAARGGEYSWHDLWSCFGNFWKIFIITILMYLGCTLASLLLVFPGVILFYKWRLSFFVLAEHPDYGPIQCMKQSRRLMEGEKMNLFKLDVACWLLYGLAGIVWYVTSGILPLWKMPSILILYTVFYNRMVYWKEPEENVKPPENPQ